MKEPSFLFPELGYPYANMPQRAKNEYFYKIGESINDYYVKYNKTDKWKSEKFEELTSKVGMPKKLTFFQRLFEL
jgi:hypothetical protein